MKRRVLDQSTRSGLRVVVVTICDGTISLMVYKHHLAPTDHSWSVDEALSDPVLLLLEQITSLELSRVFWRTKDW